MKKGDIVDVRAVVYTAYRTKAIETKGETVAHMPEKGDDRKCLFRLACEPWRGLVVGWSHLVTGNYTPGSWFSSLYEPDEYERASLSEDTRHRVWLIEPLGASSNRYIKPVPVLEADLKIVLNGGCK